MPDKKFFNKNRKVLYYPNDPRKQMKERVYVAHTCQKTFQLLSTDSNTYGTHCNLMYISTGWVLGERDLQGCVSGNCKYLIRELVISKR